MERLLDKAAAQKVECGAEAIEKVAVAAEGVGGAFQQPWRPPRARLLECWLARRKLAGLAVGIAGGGRAGRPVRQRHE